ncbi:glycosyltransferase family 2 protein [Rhodoglobus sp. NPDC076762]
MSREDLEAPSLLGLLDLLLQQSSVNEGFADHIRDAKETLESSLTESPRSPFLSVVMRTQGKRIEAFADALLCLAAQTDSDFELVIVMHNASEEAFEQVSTEVDRHRGLLPHVTLTRAEGGTRARPLNVGVELARGQYLAFFDDDDLLFAHWVETFHTNARAHPGLLLRSVSGIQRITPERWPDGKDGFRTLTWSMAEYANEFDPLRNYLANHSPFMSIAFPSALFATLGFRFNEELAVCEDWEVIVRGASLLGVRSVQEFTSVYRRWEDGSSSYTEHSTAEWTVAEQKLLLELDSAPTLLPAHSVSRIRTLVEDEDAAVILHEVLASKSWTILNPVRSFATKLRSLRARVIARIRRVRTR